MAFCWISGVCASSHSCAGGQRIEPISKYTVHVPRNGHIVLAYSPSPIGPIVGLLGITFTTRETKLMAFRQRNLLAICSIAFSIVATSAFADISSSENIEPETAAASAPRKATGQSKRKGRTVKAQPAAAYAAAPASSSSIVAEARRYLGTNPTKRRSLWCAAFMNMVLERTGHKRGSSDMAKSFTSYGQRVQGPRVGALAVMSRGKNGGHVGVVSGIDPSGNVIVVSGNHNNTVAESVYPRSRILAYVMPGT